MSGFSRSRVKENEYTFKQNCFVSLLKRLGAQESQWEVIKDVFLDKKWHQVYPFPFKVPFLATRLILYYIYTI